MKIVTVGSATRDIFVHYKGAAIEHSCAQLQQGSFIVLEKGRKIEVSEIHYASGGGATNSAASFNNLGFSVSSCFNVGTDEHGKAIMHDLQQTGITVQAHISSEHPTGLSIILPAHNDATVLAYHGANAHMHTTHIPFEIIKEADLLYITSLSGTSAALLPHLTAYARTHNVRVAVNPGTSQLTSNVSSLFDSLDSIEILILNAYEAGLFMHALMDTKPTLEKFSMTPLSSATQPRLLTQGLGLGTHYVPVQSFFKEVLARGPRIVVITNGAEGVYVAQEDSILFCPSIATHIINTVGAGDAFGSTFVASLMRGSPVDQAIKYGVINSACVLSHADAKAGLLTWQELEQQARLNDSFNVTTYSL